MNHLHFRVGLTAVLLWSLAMIQAQASLTDTVYDNSVNDLDFRLDPGTQEVGDEIVLDGTARELVLFEFEYWGEGVDPQSAFAGDVEARIRFYLNDGAEVAQDKFAPGTLFFDSGTFGVSATNRAILTFSDFTLGMAVPLTQNLPDTFTWSVQFSGLGAGDTAGVDIYSPPVLGDNYTDYWVNDGVGWSLQTDVVSMDFAARFEAVPEPGAWVLLALGGVALAALGRKSEVDRGASA